MSPQFVALFDRKLHAEHLRDGEIGPSPIFCFVYSRSFSMLGDWPSGEKDVGRVKSALMFATLAQLSGCDTILYCVQDGADAVVKGRIREEGKLPRGVPTYEQRLAEAHEAGVRLQLCGQVAQNQGVRKEDLVEGAEIIGGIQLITYALEFDGMLFF